MTTTSTTPMPAWLRSMLQAKGVISETGLTRNAGIRTHRPCHAACIAGIDDNGFDTWTDPTELTPTGELQALLDGRRTWDLHAHRALTLRTSISIQHRPAGNPARPVLAQHRCHQPIPSSWAMPPWEPLAAPPSTEDDECPF
ncbi:MAG: hypothetical protein Q8M17_10610 [Actinomycetota bacterium]|nr:hypothetical protein [Actinomycetota bacterium]